MAGSIQVLQLQSLSPIPWKNLRLLCWSVCLSGRHWRDKQRPLPILPMPPVPVAPVRHARVHAKSQLIRAGGHCGASFRRTWSGKVQTAVGSRNPNLHSALAQRSRHDPEPERLLTTAATCANCCVIYCTIALALLHNDLLCGEIVALWVIDWCSCERRPDLFRFWLVQDYFEHVRGLLKIQWA